jgi:adenylate cyclase
MAQLDHITADIAHILVVDDDPGIRRMFQQLLYSSGYRVSAAGSGEEALAYLDLITPDLILMDVNLPGISGLEAIAMIKADSTKPFIPIVLITARDEQKLKVQGFDAGADDFLVKPVDLTELLARVRALLRLQRSRRSLRAEQRKTELLLHLTRALSTTLDLDQLLTHFLDRLADAVGAIRASIILIIDEQPRLYSNTRNPPLTPLDEILRDGIAGWVLRERQPAVIVDTRNDERWIGAAPQQKLVRSVAAMPILRDDRRLGAITLVHHTPGYFTDEHVDLLSSVAAQCAFALENAELYQLTRQQKDLIERRAEELQRINQVGGYLSELMSPDQLTRLVVHLIHNTFGYPHVAMLIREAGELVIRSVASSFDIEHRQGLRQPLDGGYAGMALAQGVPVRVGDVAADQQFVSAGAGVVRSVLALPVMTARDTFGVLEVASDQPQAFGADDERLLSTLTSQLAVALKNAQLFDTEQRRVRQLERMNHLSIAITAQIDPTANLHVAAEAIGAIFGVETCGIAVTGGSFRANARVALHSNRSLVSGTPLTFQFPMAQLADMRLDAPVVIPAAGEDGRLAAITPILAQSRVESLVLAPLLAAGRRVGLIAIDATGLLEQFGHGELTLLETVASLIGQVLENARLYREVEDERSTLNAVLRGAADPILLIDPENQLLLANRAAEVRLGIGPGVGQPIADLSLQPDLQAALGNGQGQAGTATPHEVTLPGGETFSISVAPVHGADNSLIGRVAVIQDITAIKELERREQERLRSVFRRYVSPPVVEEVLAHQGDFGEPAERDVTVVFADIRGYTTLTEGFEPRVLVERVLNRYFTAMTEVLYRYGGTIDKFLGDGLIGLFGVPIARPGDISRALRAANDMQRAFAELQQSWRAEFGLDIGMGIGISHGRAVVGNIGSAQRLDYTVIGDVVNTANRLNGMAGPGQIMVSFLAIEALTEREAVPGQLREIGRVQLKGKQEPHLVYELEYDVEVQLIASHV